MSWNKMYKGFLRANDGVPEGEFKNLKKSDLLTYEQVVSRLGDYVGVLDDGWVMIDFDDTEEAEIMLKIIEGEGIECNVLRTSRGVHCYFRIREGAMKCNRTDWGCAIGLHVDTKLGNKNTVDPLRKEGVDRQWIKVVDMPELVPFWLYPLKKSKDFRDSDTRNSDLYTYILPLQGSGYSKEQIKRVIELINKYVLKTPLSGNELDVVLRDESFLKPCFFNDKTFLHDVFAKWLMNNKNVVKFDDMIYFYKDQQYVDFRKLYREMLDEIPILKKAQRQEVFHYMNDYIIENKSEANPNLINVANGIYNIETDELLEHSPDVLITNKIATQYNPNAAISSAVDEAISAIACGNKELIKLLYEMIGYSLYRRNELAKAFILIGEGSNGKSTLLQMISKLLGENNTSSISLKDTQDRFRASEVIGKLANLGDDIGDAYIDESQEFKKMVGGNTTTFEAKGIQPFKKAVYTKFIFSCNTIPRCKDTTYGFMRRLILIPLRANFSKSKNFNPYIVDELVKDEALEYLLLRAIEGLKRVLKNKKFTECDDVNNEIKDYEEINNSVLGYIADGGKFENESIEDSYRRYNLWCVENGLYSISKIKLGKELKRIFGLISYPVTINGKTIKMYRKEDS